MLHNDLSLVGFAVDDYTLTAKNVPLVPLVNGDLRFAPNQIVLAGSFPYLVHFKYYFSWVDIN
jgi:hypothetical protein